MDFDLTGVWLCDDGGIYYMRQSSDKLWWCGLSNDKGLQRGLTFSNVFCANVNELHVKGDWADVPRGITHSFGTLILVISLDDVGNPVTLTKVNDTGGFSGASWSFSGRSSKAGFYTIQDLFELVNKTDFTPDLIHRETLARNLDPAKEQAVVLFGRVRPMEDDDFGNHWLFDCSFPRSEIPTLDAFWNLNSWYDADLTQQDADSNFDIEVRYARLPTDFFDGLSQADQDAVESKRAGPINDQTLRVHCEMIMYGRTDGPPYVPLLPGWGDTNGNSILVNGRPLNGNLVILDKDQVGTIAGHVPFDGEYVRVTGVLAFDKGHGEEGNDRGLEIHPVYALDFVDVTSSDDLSGAWATSDGGTCYVRQLFTAIWFLWMRPYRDRRYATVFRGTRVGATITGNWIDMPLGDRTGTGDLILIADDQKLQMSADPTSEFADITWHKLYDTAGLTCPTAKLAIEPSQWGNCLGVVLAGATEQYRAILTNSVIGATFSWSVSGADGAQVSSDTFEITTLPSASSMFTVHVTATDSNGCTWQSQRAFLTGTQEDVDKAAALCDRWQHLVQIIHQVQWPPRIGPLPSGDPFMAPAIGQLEQIQNALTEVIGLAEHLSTSIARTGLLRL